MFHDTIIVVCMNGVQNRISYNPNKKNSTRYQKSDRLLPFRLISIQLFLSDCHIESKQRNQFSVYFSYKLHHYLLIDSNHWSPISWYLNGYLRLLHIQIYKRVSIPLRLLFSSASGFLLLCARAFMENTSTLTAIYGTKSLASNTKANKNRLPLKKWRFVSKNNNEIGAKCGKKCGINRNAI